MIRARFKGVSRVLGLLVMIVAALTAHAEDHKKTKVKWRAGGVITGQAYPFTTASYFKRPLVQGELVWMTFTVDTAVAGFVTGSYASYENAIMTVKVEGSDWSISMKSPLARGAVAIADDDPNYGDSLFLDAYSIPIPNKTWYGINFSMQNPGGPNPGTGPWAPFTSLAMPKSLPPLGLMPNSGFYISARRDLPGQELDGGSYFGQILWITAERCDD